MRSSILIFE
jgi:hypothetical protein